MKEVIFKGCGTALVTPFTTDGINFEELRKLIEFQILEEVIFYYEFRRKKICYWI